MAYVELGKFTEAERELRKMLEVDSTDLRAHIGLGAILFMQERYEEGIAAYEGITNDFDEGANVLLRRNLMRAYMDFLKLDDKVFEKNSKKSELKYRFEELYLKYRATMR